jgi:hypothetical protein
MNVYHAMGFAQFDDFYGFKARRLMDIFVANAFNEESPVMADLVDGMSADLEGDIT